MLNLLGDNKEKILGLVQSDYESNFELGMSLIESMDLNFDMDKFFDDLYRSYVIIHKKNIFDKSNKRKALFDFYLSYWEYGFLGEIDYNIVLRNDNNQLKNFSDFPPVFWYCDGTYDISISDSNFKYIPDLIIDLPELNTIEFKNCNIERLPQSFKGLDLRVLNLEGNNIDLDHKMEIIGWFENCEITF